jgi:predicted small secreted protein
MKKILLLVVLLLFAGMSLNGCSTWHGVKKDANRTWDVVTA